MDKRIIGISIFISALLAHHVCSAASIESIKAPFHVGETLMVCGQVFDVAKQPKRTLLNLGAAYPNEHISILIWNNNLKPFEHKFGDLSALQNARICSQGQIHQYKEHLFMTVKNPNMLRKMK